MMMVENSSQYAASTMSSETLSGSCSSRTNRIRTVRLVRPSNASNFPPPSLTCRHGPSLGFSVRGGREHGTGFFVSHVEPASEAQRQGLMVGDQIIRVNGFTVEDAVHKEVLQLISNNTHLTLKVRSVGMIPVKDKKTDALSWQIISDNNSLRLSPSLSEKIQDARISIIVSPRSKLGCGICKGPDWKPGIFVQFTKEGGIAREAGLRPGDQILMCNNVDFSDISFNEAVNLMKTSRQLDLLIRKCAGSELFPGESSGYNSSASSVTGDQSPSWSDSKRLSIVKEESFDLEDRLDRLKSTKQWGNYGWDENDENDRPLFKPTIINLSENGTTITNNGNEDCLNEDDNYGTLGRIKNEEIYGQTKVKTIVDVHRSDVDEQTEKANQNDLAQSNSVSSFASFSSLSSALSQEIQRRSEKKKLDTKPSIDDQLQMKKLIKGVSSDKQHQHSKLMDEFKKAHKRMFKSLDENKIEKVSNLDDLTLTRERAAEKELSQKLSERLSSLQQSNENRNGTLGRQAIVCDNPQIPPPPPPLPMDTNFSNGQQNEEATNTLKPNKTKPKAPPVPQKVSSISSIQPPPCPTPDYDTISITSTISNKQNGCNLKSSQDVSDSVEMESLESFVLYNTADQKPKPPERYFNSKPILTTQLSHGSVSSNSTLGRQIKPRPVSVTIGEYSSNGTVRKTPGKLDFLQNGVDEIKLQNQPITSQLASELAQTLNRSNLRRKTESMENLLFSPQIKPLKNGSVRISLGQMSKHLAKSTNDLSSLNNLTKAFSNKVMINLDTTEKKIYSPGGILKNTNGPACVTNHKPLVQQKSITFGEM